MQYPVIVRGKDIDQYEAEPVGIPELKAVATTEADAVGKVVEALGKWFASAKVVQVEVPTDQSSNPWLDAFGRSADDPDFDEFMGEIARARKENAS